MTYADLLPVGTVLAMCAASFGLGIIYGNLPYDYYTLWLPDREAIARSVAHYAIWANAPRRVHYILHGVMALGLLGCFIKMFKPHPDVKYFEWGTLGALMLAIMIYFTNLRIGVNSCVSGIWGDVDEITGINVMAASQFMMAVVLFGVLVLQGGLYYAQWYENKIQREFYEAERAAAAAAAAPAVEIETEVVEEVSGSTGSKKSKSGLAKKRA
ncbi:hypothetical protein PUMCH_005162 [Australozyma saopauloensis]|uniref:Secretory component protein SHR3 n=1 Tax=Australozyma saopauloensis TaxID=291208 RepID=A0AAX4HHN1_9ASCO|nr:hypothetical protein PUMCH_005162 [[Candida] saopauloensis]